jgi:hypothetical protein
VPVGCAADVSKDAVGSIFCTDLSKGKMFLINISIKRLTDWEGAD